MFWSSCGSPRWTATTDPRDMKSMHIVLCQFWNAVVVKYQNSQAYTNTGILSNRLIELNLTKQHTRSISRSSMSLRGHTRVRHMATRTGVCVCVRICLCACLCGVVHLSREQGDTDRSAGEGQCPRDAFVPTPLVPPALPQNCRSFAAHAFLRASLHQRPWDNAAATKEGATLQQAVS